MLSTDKVMCRWWWQSWWIATEHRRWGLFSWQWATLSSSSPCLLRVGNDSIVSRVLILVVVGDWNSSPRIWCPPHVGTTLVAARILIFLLHPHTRMYKCSWRDWHDSNYGEDPHPPWCPPHISLYSEEEEEAMARMKVSFHVGRSPTKF